MLWLKSGEKCLFSAAFFAAIAADFVLDGWFSSVYSRPQQKSCSKQSRCSTAAFLFNANQENRHF